MKECVWCCSPFMIGGICCSDGCDIAYWLNEDLWDDEYEEEFF